MSRDGRGQFTLLNVGEGGGGGGLGGRRRVRGSEFTRSKFSSYAFADDYLMYTAFLTVIFAAAYCTCVGLIFSERKWDKIDTHYWLEGDNSVNGDSYHNTNFAAGAMFGVIAIFVVSGLNFLLRHTNYEFNGKKAYADSSNHTNNAVTHGPISIAEALVLVSFVQATGTSNVWAMAYAAMLSLFGDWLSTAIRVIWAGDRRAGSSVFSVFCYVIIKLTPLVWVAVAGARNSLSDTMTAAWWIFFGFACLRILLVAGVYLHAMMSPSAEMYKKIFMQPNLKDFKANVTASGETVMNRALNSMKEVKWFQTLWGSVAFLNVLCFTMFMVSTMTAFGLSNNVARKVYGRVTWTRSIRWNDASTAELDRTWPVLQVAVPLQFGLIMLFGIYQTAMWEKTLKQWALASDYLNDFAYAVADFWAVWVVLNLTGTTELSELIFAGVAILACNAIITEARRQYPWYFSVAPCLLGLVPFIHAAINLANMAHHNDIELIGVIIFFAAYACRALVYFFFRFRTKGDIYYYFDGHPGTYVLARFFTDWIVRFCVVAVWLGGGFDHGWQVVNDK